MIRTVMSSGNHRENEPCLNPLLYFPVGTVLYINHKYLNQNEPQHCLKWVQIWKCLFDIQITFMMHQFILKAYVVDCSPFVD